MKFHGEAAQAALLSAFVIPGAGQIFNGNLGKGMLLAFLFLAASLGCLVPITIAVVQYYLDVGSGVDETLQAQSPLQTLAEMWVSLLFLFFASVVIYLYSIYDAYQVRQNTPIENNSQLRPPNQSQ